jgi:hypothetical protein
MDATKHQTARQVALERFERATELPLLILALAMIPLLLAPAVADLSDTLRQRCSRSTGSYGQRSRSST